MKLYDYEYYPTAGKVEKKVLTVDFIDETDFLTLDGGYIFELVSLGLKGGCFYSLRELKESELNKVKNETLKRLGWLN